MQKNGRPSDRPFLNSARILFACRFDMVEGLFGMSGSDIGVAHFAMFDGGFQMHDGFCHVWVGHGFFSLFSMLKGGLGVFD
jgi:hypothetical protein